MPLWSFQAMFAFAVIATLVSGIWLLIHLTAVTRTFAGNADIVPSPEQPRMSPAAVRSVLAAFAVGLMATLAFVILVWTGAAQAGLE